MMRSIAYPKDDEWGIRKTLREIFFKNNHNTRSWGWDVPLEFKFEIFYSQFVPPAYKQSKKTIIRHLEQINKMVREVRDYVWTYRKTYDHRYDKREVWSVSYDPLTDNLYQRIVAGEVKLPTYMKIEKEKMRWQKSPVYDKDQGVSQPIEEEVVQLRIIKK